jgi:transcriptional regulator with XRE-family HTH domain
MIVLRRELGEALRARRQSQGRTLRQVSSAASVSLGYLSEVERGEKEASSELLSAICHALGHPAVRGLGRCRAPSRGRGVRQRGHRAAGHVGDLSGVARR